MSSYFTFLTKSKAEPVGAVVLRISTSVKADDYLLSCDGSAVSRTTYAALFAVIGTTYGVGNGSTTFNLPDFRGRFLRCFPGSSTYDSYLSTRLANGNGQVGNYMGTTQVQSMGSHSHQTTGPAYYPSAGSGGSSMTIPTYSTYTASTSTSSSETTPLNHSVKMYIRYRNS